jgi:photosystem II stability/assembly factor-like uncharacterized protein
LPPAGVLDILGETMRPRSLPILTTAVLCLALAACGSGRHTSPPVMSATTVATSIASTASTPAATTTGTSGLGGAGAQSAPVGGPVPAGFAPASFTAISSRTWWLLGDAPCSHPLCTSIVRTTDGGAHFVAIPAPAARLAGAGGAGISDLRFADSLDGFAGPDAAGSSGVLWETHDGGARWTAGPAIITFTVSGGQVYAIAGSCGHGTCSNLRLLRSPAPLDRWSATPLGVASSGAIAITAHGRALWISLTPATGTPSTQTLLASLDRGAHLTRLASPCSPGLGGDIEAASSRVVWAVCPTGMMAGAWRSSDAGAHWSSLHTHGLANSARIGPASETAAVLATGGAGAVLRTTDSGRSFTRVHGLGGGAEAVTWIGFTDPSTASAILDRGGAGQLWRSGDGGRSFSGPVRFR